MRRSLEAAGQVGSDMLAADWAHPSATPGPPALRNSGRILLTSVLDVDGVGV